MDVHVSDPAHTGVTLLSPQFGGCLRWRWDLNPVDFTKPCQTSPPHPGANLLLLPAAACRRFYNRDVQPHQSGSAVFNPAEKTYEKLGDQRVITENKLISETTNWSSQFSSKHLKQFEDTLEQLHLQPCCQLTGASGSFFTSMSGGNRILLISWKIPLTLTSSLYVTLAWLMKMLPWKYQKKTFSSLKHLSFLH